MSNTQLDSPTSPNRDVFYKMLTETGMIKPPIDQEFRKCKGIKNKIDGVKEPVLTDR